MEYTKIIDGEGLIAGRLASTVSKELLMGETIAIVNCEKVIITGRKENILAKYQSLVHKGKTTRGPYFPRRSDMLLKRIIRGMLPHKKTKGRDALSRVKCFISVPEEFKDQKFTKFKEATTRKIEDFMTIRELTKKLGARL